MDEPIDGEIIEPEFEPDDGQPAEQLEYEDPFARLLFPSRPFGEMLGNVRRLSFGEAYAKR